MSTTAEYGVRRMAGLGPVELLMLVLLFIAPAAVLGLIVFAAVRVALRRGGHTPPTSAARFCSECGDPLADRARFCSTCGTSVIITSNPPAM